MKRKVKARIAIPDGNHLVVVTTKGKVIERTADQPVGVWDKVVLPEETAPRRKHKRTRRA